MWFSKCTMTVSPTLRRSSGPGIEPLNVRTLAMTPLPISTVWGSARIVVSKMFGSGFVSTASGTTYGLPPDVASAGSLERNPTRSAAMPTASAVTSVMRPFRRRKKATIGYLPPEHALSAERPRSLDREGANGWLIIGCDVSNSEATNEVNRNEGAMCRIASTAREVDHDFRSQTGAIGGSHDSGDGVAAGFEFDVRNEPTPVKTCVPVAGAQDPRWRR